jgi:hypothetical protein
MGEQQDRDSNSMGQITLKKYSFRLCFGFCITLSLINEAKEQFYLCIEFEWVNVESGEAPLASQQGLCSIELEASKLFSPPLHPKN